jgi:hypothetical protein
LVVVLPLLQPIEAIRPMATARVRKVFMVRSFLTLPLRKLTQNPRPNGHTNGTRPRDASRTSKRTVGR